MIREILFILFVWFSILKPCNAQISQPSHHRPRVSSGDLILISMDCHLCGLIERETNSPYSHLGVIWVDPQGSAWVFHSLGANGVHRSLYSDFVKYAKRGSTPTIRSWKGLGRWTDLDSAVLESEFRLHFENHPYDPKFLWYVEGQPRERESFYCSELIAKLMIRVFPSLTPELSPIPMTYDKQLAEWTQYFGGPPPEGLPGLSPGFFAVSSLWSDEPSIQEDLACLSSFGRLGKSYPTKW